MHLKNISANKVASMFSTEKGAANLLIAVVVGLILIKIIVGWASGSISVLAQAMDSLLDLFAGLVTFFAIRISTKPADEDHAFGHGKVEDMAGMTQGALIFIAAGLIVFSAIMKIMRGTSVEFVEAGIAVMLISMIASILLSRHLASVSKQTGSIALEANANNIKADIFSTLAVLLGLVIVRVTGLNTVDSIVAIGMAIYISKIAYDTLGKPLLGLVDASLPAEERVVIESCLSNHSEQVVGYHELRTRRSGNQRYIDVHVVMAKDVSVRNAHDVCDRLEIDIKRNLPRASITIHVEPCEGICKQCAKGYSKCRGD
jgi:cation diffusion facilitator family transporter